MVLHPFNLSCAHAHDGSGILSFPSPFVCTHPCIATPGAAGQYLVPEGDELPRIEVFVQALSKH